MRTDPITTSPPAADTADNSLLQLPIEVAATMRQTINCQVNGDRLLAEAGYRSVLRHSPDFGPAINNLGVLLMERGALEDAEACFRKALAVSQQDADAWHNLGNLLREHNRVAEAAEAYAKALALRPDFVEARYNEALAHLKLGNMPDCWDKWESRWDSQQLAQSRRDFKQPRYTGAEPLAGKRILIHAEQGMGDMLQMVRYLRLLHERGATIVLETRPGLRQLLSAMPEVESVHARGDTLPDTDYVLPVMSLPGVFGTTLANLPFSVPYIPVRPEVRERVAALLANAPRPLVGVCWRGNPKFSRDKDRSPGLAALSPLWSVAGVSYVPLVPHARNGFKSTVGAPAFDPGLDITETAESFEETAALMMHLDLIISSDTSVCHLAGALGRPVWIALSYVSDWRWLLNREDSPWYPTARLFRQPSRGDWEAVFKRIATELEVQLRQIAQVRARMKSIA